MSRIKCLCGTCRNCVSREEYKRRNARKALLDKGLPIPPELALKIRKKPLLSEEQWAERYAKYIDQSYYSEDIRVNFCSSSVSLNRYIKNPIS